MNIDLKQLEALLKVLEERDISEFEYEDESSRVHLKRGQPAAAHHPVAGAPPAHTSSAAQAAHAELSEPAARPAEANVAYVTSPFVGTFYRSPSPDAAPFVDAGSNIRAGQALCIVEAMKLMNEIEAEFAGTVVECLVQTGSPVEFGQRLFKVKKA